MPGLSEQLVSWLEEIHRITKQRLAAGFTVTATDARMALAGCTYAFGPKLPAQLAEQELLIAGIPCRLFGADNMASPRPTLLYLHGGGHVTGSVDVYASILRKIAEVTESWVVAADYALAPESPYPQGLNDTRQVLEHVRTSLATLGIGCTDALYLLGDSAGGALAATLAIESSWQPNKITGVGLIYPSLDYSLSTPAIETYGEGYMLTRERINWYFEQYFQHDEDRRACSPLFMPIGPHLPPVTIVAADHCPLVDESRQWAATLKQQGHMVTLDIIDHSVHASLNLEKLCPQASASFYRAINNIVAR